MEFLIVCAILQELMGDEWDWEQAKSIDSGDILAAYCCVRNLAHSLNLDTALFERTQENIEKLMKRMTLKWDVFRQKCMTIKVAM